MHYLKIVKSLFILFLVLILVLANNISLIADPAQAATTPSITVHNTRARPIPGGPTLNDPNLRVEQIFTGLQDSTSMVFLGPNDILVLEKDRGTVQRIVNNQMLSQPVLDVNVANRDERGLLGIAVAKHNEEDVGGPTYVFLYFTESGGGNDGDDATSPGVEPLGNRVYRYELVNNELVNPKLLLDLPATPPPERGDIERQHMGGKVLIGPDKNVYVGIGDVGAHRTMAENTANGPPPDGTGGILRVTQDGQAVPNSPLSDGDNTDPNLNFYYAYGMRNTFGMDFDPVTGKLWDTENGPTYGDEINLVEPGFNSGWAQIQGMAKDQLRGKAVDSATDLVNFGGKGVYRDPEFVWITPIAPTSLKFLNSDKLGKEYQNTIFVGDVDLGYLYNFKLNQQRTGLLLDDVLADKVANTPDEMQQGGTIFGSGFGVITDLQVGPDGNLYVLTLRGSIFRISSSSPL
jgi:glucose/arabinose dehydrogenase